MSSKRAKQRFAKLKNALTLYVFILLMTPLIFTLSSCKTGQGCKATEQYKVKTDKHGNLSMKRGKTKLFDKKTEKKRKRKIRS